MQEQVNCTYNHPTVLDVLLPSSVVLDTLNNIEAVRLRYSLLYLLVSVPLSAFTLGHIHIHTSVLLFLQGSVGA